MKSFFAVLAVALATLFASMPMAEARPGHRHGHGHGHRHHHHHHHGYHHHHPGYRYQAPRVYTERYIIRYDRYGRPVWGYRTVPRYYAPRPVPVIPPPYRGYSGSRIIISGSIGL